MDLTRVWADTRYLAPEVGLTLLLLLVILIDLALPREKRPVGFVALVGTILLMALAAAAWRSYPDATFVSGGAAGQDLFGGSVVYDRFALFFKILFLGSAAVAVVMTQPVVRNWTTGQGEMYALLLSCTLGMLLMAGAQDLLTMYLSLEFVSVTGYILAGMRQRDRRSSEASLKYILYGAAASGMMIYGMTFLYGLTGTLDVAEIGARLAGPPGAPATMMVVISVLILVGFGYKIAAAPFHMWCPDVYEGAPTPVTAFFSVGPKAAGFAMMVRFVAGVFHTGGADAVRFEWHLVIAILAVLTMAVGTLGALLQQNLKRLMAYSSIGHAGYLLLAFTVFQAENVASLLFYLAVYVIMNLGAFLVVLAVEERYGVRTVDECRGLGWRAPILCGVMTLFLVSLTGLPPTAGFVGKFLVFGYLVQTGGGLAIGLVVLAVLMSVVSLYFYARIVGSMFLSPPEGETKAAPLPVPYSILLAVLTAGTLWYGVAPSGLIQTSRRAAYDMRPRIEPVGAMSDR